MPVLTFIDLEQTFSFIKTLNEFDIGRQRHMCYNYYALHSRSERRVMQHVVDSSLSHLWMVRRKPVIIPLNTNRKPYPKYSVVLFQPLSVASLMDFIYYINTKKTLEVLSLLRELKAHCSITHLKQHISFCFFSSTTLGRGCNRSHILHPWPSGVLE